MVIKEENFVGAGANAEDVFGNMIEGHNNDAEAHANIRKAIGNALNVHAKDNILHVTTEEKRKWDNAAETAKREAQSVAGEIRQDMEDLEERVELKIESKAYHESTGSYAEIFNDYENNVADGDYSHAEGYKTIANGFCQHVGGKFNTPDDKALIIIGNGTSETDRRNAYTLDENGNAIYSGHVTAKKFCDVNGNDMKDICSNALNVTASGKTICAYDVSPIEHQAKVQVASKNILNVNHAPIVHTNPVAKVYRWERTETGFRAQFIEERPSNAINHGYVIGETEGFKGKTITVSYGEAILNPDANPTIAVMLTQKKGVLNDSFDETMGFLGSGYTGAIGTNMLIKNNYNVAKTQNYITATIPNDSDAETYPYVVVVFYIGQGCDNPADSVVEYKNIQVEIGDAMTAYTPWVDIEDAEVIAKDDTGAINKTYTPNEDGTVDNVSVASYLNLETNQDGVVLEVTYNKDINKAIKELTNAIISLGGDI